jgi:hypothetical protein
MVRVKTPSMMPGATVVSRRSQPRQFVLAVATQPGVHRLAGHPVTLGDLNNRGAAGDDLHDGVITLLHDAQLHEHQPGSPHTTPVARSRPEGGRVTHHLKPACHPSSGVRHTRFWTSPRSRSHQQHVHRGGGQQRCQGRPKGVAEHGGVLHRAAAAVTEQGAMQDAADEQKTRRWSARPRLRR